MRQLFRACVVGESLVKRGGKAPESFECPVNRRYQLILQLAHVRRRVPGAENVKRKAELAPPPFEVG
jgi:hypothetical protein